MFSSIKQKLILMYIVLIIIPLFVINYFFVNNMRDSLFHEIEVNTLKTANIISNLSRDNFNDIEALKDLVTQYSPSLGGRILVLDNEKNVLVDSFDLLENRQIDNSELRSALLSKDKIGYYQTDKNILQAAVPITKTVNDQKSVIGVVLTSATIDEPLNQLRYFRSQLIMLSLGCAIIAIIAAIIASNRLSRPITKLSHAARTIAQGSLGRTVDIKSKDEIGRLADNFNYMSKELQRIDQGRTQFIGDVSHELKTPLSSMKALIDSLLYGEDNIEVYREYLKDMDCEIDRLSGLIKSLLTLTKVEEQSLKLKPAPLNDIVDQAVKILKPLANKHEVTISIELLSCPRVLCDIERLKEALINLIDNGLKYRDLQKQDKKLWILGRLENNNYILIVRDNGIGIAKEDTLLIFDKFYRTDLSRSRDTGGAGIGLSITSKIIKLHGWDIKVESELNKGTSFTISIPKTSFETSS